MDAEGAPDRWRASGSAGTEVYVDMLDGLAPVRNAVQEVDGHYEMVVARGTNLHGTEDFPPQGLWWLRSDSPSGRRADWTRDPVRLLDTDHDPAGVVRQRRLRAVVPLRRYR